jgi:hypothetical protein
MVAGLRHIPSLLGGEEVVGVEDGGDHAGVGEVIVSGLRCIAWSQNTYPSSGLTHFEPCDRRCNLTG